MARIFTMSVLLMLAWLSAKAEPGATLSAVSLPDVIRENGVSGPLMARVAVAAEGANPTNTDSFGESIWS